MKECKVLQIREDAPDSRNKKFMSYFWVIDHYGKIDPEDYECVYEGQISDDMFYDDVFEMCNINHPIGYRGHSLSVSDIVVIDGKAKYCNSFGWENVEM